MVDIFTQSKFFHQSLLFQQQKIAEQKSNALYFDSYEVIMAYAYARKSCSMQWCRYVLYWNFVNMIFLADLVCYYCRREVHIFYEFVAIHILYEIFSKKKNFYFGISGNLKNAHVLACMTVQWLTHFKYHLDLSGLWNWTRHQTGLIHEWEKSSCF